MMSVNLGSPYSAGFQITTPTRRAADADTAAQAAADGTAPVGVKVNLSSAAIEKSAAAKATGDDTTTDPIKMLEKRIKEIQKEIAAAEAQLQTIQANKHLSADEKQTESGAIQAQLGQLNASMSTATAQLAKLLQQQAQNAANQGSAAAFQPA